MKRWILLALASLAGLGLVYTTKVAPRWLRVSRLSVKTPGLPPDLNGLRIAHLSDFHLGARGMSTGHIHQARREALSFGPDIIALTGDYYEAGVEIPSEGLYEDWPEHVPVLAVMGNHDRRGTRSLERTIAELQAGGAIVLNNQAVTVEVRGQTVWVCGFDDAHTFNDDVRRALVGVPGGEVPLLALSHSPATIRDLHPGDARILLAGHTHGGQIRLLPSGAVPFVRQIRRARGLVDRPDGPVYRRWHWLKGTIVIISDGLGVSTLPMRFRTRPHLVLIELRPADPLDTAACDDIRRYVREENPEPWLIRVLT